MHPYNICSYVDLLRIIRNIFAHSHENPAAMKAQFGLDQPSPDDIFITLSKQFPYFYLHSWFCFTSLFKQRQQAHSKVFAKTYQDYEDKMCQRGLSEGTLASLQENSNVVVHFSSAYNLKRHNKVKHFNGRA